MIVHGRRTPSVALLAERLVDCAVQLRWGGGFAPGAINGTVSLLDGLEQLQAFQRAGVACPQFTNELAVAQRWSGAGQVVLSRRANHSQGKDIRPSTGPRERGRRAWTVGDFWSVYTPAVREWRFHILRRRDGTYTSIGRGLKVWAGAAPAPTEGVIIRSRRLGWHLDHSVKPPKVLRELAKQACAAVQYDLGAVDLLELADGSGLVLEVNSRPALRDTYTLTAYTEALRSY